MMSYSVSVMENASVGTVVLNVIAQPTTSPPSSCSNFSSITYSTIPAMLGTFAIKSNGTIVIREGLDFETQQFHVFNVVAEDGCSQATAAVNITVLNVDDSPVCLDNVLYVSISESTPPSNTTLNLHCTDPDNFASTIMYTIVMGNDTGDFDIKSDGYLFTLKQLNYELQTQHLLLIHAARTTYPLAVTEVTIVITVLPSNEFAPVFSASIGLSYNISESLPIGSSIANITAEDKDGGYDGIISYSLSTMQDCFVINPTGGNLALLCVLDRELQDVYYVTVLAKDNPANHSSQRCSNATIRLNVLDINDNTPNFVQSLYTLSVLETVTVGTVLLTFHCTDADEGANANVTYYIVNGNSLNRFSVDPTSGDLSVGSPVDYESHQLYHLKVQCSDGGVQQLSSIVSVVIQVLGVNEYDPVIQLDYNGLYYIPEDQPVGTVILNVSATDLDSGPAGEIVYSINRSYDAISSRCPEELFQIDPSSGSLYLVSTLDKELDSPTYECPLVVSNQQPDRQATSVLRLSVINVNDVAPTCDQALIIVDIFENFTVGNDICSFVCQDGDSPVLAYSIADPSIPFSVTHNSTHVLIQLSAQLDYETQTRYSFEVTITDMGIPPLSTMMTVHVNVKNVNEHPPVFITGESNAISIPEDTRVGTVLYSFSACDNDSDVSSDLHYTIVEGNDNHLVVLNEATGVLYLAVASLDHETLDHFHLTVEVTDNDPFTPLTDTTHLNVSVSDINDNAPVFSNTVYFVSLVENTVIGSLFNLPICTDDDDDDGDGPSCQILMACSYIHGNSCVPITINSSLFSFNFNVGEGIVTSLLDYEAAMFYVFNILCTDQGIPELSATAVVYVEVTPVNEFTPSFDSPSYNITVDEDFAIGLSFLRVTASDLDSGLDGELVYSLSSSLNHFAIDPNNGSLFLTQYLDWEKETSYVLEVIASDNSPSASRSTQVTVYVGVTDVNDNIPYCEQGTIIIRMSESTPVGSSVIWLNCSDSDQLNTLHYTILSGNDRGLFSVHDNGSIVLLSTPDVEQYHLIVSVADTSPDPLAVTVNCFVYVDRVNQPPTFDSINLSLPLSTQQGSLLLTVNASDGGSDVVQYSLLPSGIFLEIDRWNGDIYLIRKLLRSQIGLHVFILRAVTRELTSIFNLTVEVVDTSYSLRFSHSLYFVSVAEDAGVNTTLLTVHCTDNYGEDVHNLQYHFTVPITLFHIVQSTGLLSTSAPLDFELKDDYNLSVVCVDPTAPSVQSIATVMVTILPVNEHAPLLVSSIIEVNITENNSVGQHILQVNATDKDKGSQLRYYLSEDFRSFYLDALSGVLYLIQSLDYESRTSYNLSVIVVDEAPTIHASFGNIIVHIIDSNDHNPFCDPSFITKVVSDNAKVGQSVVTLNCVDHDSGVNSQLWYSVMYNNTDVLTVNRNTGEIFVAHALNTSTLSCFLIVLVSDSGYPALTFTVTVEISIQHLSNVTSIEHPSVMITADDEGKNNSLQLVDFAHLTCEQVGYVNCHSPHCTCMCCSLVVAD